MHLFQEQFDFCSMLVVAIVGYVVVTKIETVIPQFVRALRTVGAIAFLGGSAWAYSLSDPAKPFELMAVIVFGVVAAEAGMLAAAVIVPLVTGVVRWCHGGVVSRRMDAERRRRDKEQAERDERERRERQLAWERDAPERERREREADALDRARAAAQRRRDAARSECLLYFHLHAPEIDARFSRATYDEYVETYLRDDVPPEEVERQAAKLQGLMEGHLEKAGAKRRPFDVGSLARWYEEQRATIEAQRLPDESKENALALLYERYETLMQKHLEELKP